MADGKLVGLPITVASPVDLGRLIREAEALDNVLTQAALRGSASATTLPKMSELLNQTIDLNKLNLLQPADRKLLLQFLIGIREKAPRLHMSFSADPSPQFSAKLASWLRENIHPLVLITIGLQPNIGAGAMIRTTNKYFDFSLGKELSKNKKMLMQQLREAIAQNSTPQTMPASMPVAAAAATEPAKVAA